jgi:hypothetical protein
VKIGAEETCGMVVFGDIGIPMIFIQWPLMFGALVPVIILEALVIRRWLRLPLRSVMLGVAKANVFSTLVGIPLAWLVMFVFEIVTIFPFALAATKWKWEFDSPVCVVFRGIVAAAWVLPEDAYLHWMVPVAVTVLLIPCFFLSVFLERRSCLRTWRAMDPGSVRRGVLVANLASYSLLFVLACALVSFELATKGPKVVGVRARWAVPQMRENRKLPEGRESLTATPGTHK